MADSNISGKRFVLHDVIGNKRRDVVEFTVTDDGSGSIVNTRLRVVEAAKLYAQDASRRNYVLSLINNPVGHVTIGAWPASTTGVKMILEAYGV